MIPLFKVHTNPSAKENVSKVLDSGMLGEGPMVAEFTKELERLFDSRYVIPLNSCTSALIMAMRLLDVRPGDEVITPAFTMVATSCAVAASGATPVFADVESGGLNISVEDVGKKITPKTKAIVMTHVAGNPCDWDGLRKFGLPIVADCAHAVTTLYKTVNIARFSDISCFSFQAIKQLNTGDGGAIVLNTLEQHKRAEMLKWFGMSRIIPKDSDRLTHQMTTDIPDWGYKFHMNDIAAAIGLANIKDVNEIVRRHQNNAYLYDEYFLESEKFSVPIRNMQGISTFWVYPIFTPERDRMMEYLNDKGIQSSPMWRRNDHYSAFTKYNLPNLEEVSKNILFIPNGWWMDEFAVKEVIGAIDSFKL